MRILMEDPELMRAVFSSTVEAVEREQRTQERATVAENQLRRAKDEHAAAQERTAMMRRVLAAMGAGVKIEVVQRKPGAKLELAWDEPQAGPVQVTFEVTVEQRAVVPAPERSRG